VNTGGFAKGYSGSMEANGGQVNINSYAYNTNCIPAPTQTEAVGLLLPNELGQYDMSGNVWQWCWDWVAAYPGGALTDPVYNGSSSTVTGRAIRGDCWFDPPVDQKISNRQGIPPYKNFYHTIGFRVVRP
jgi:formylglycine-generating enzyme required for sulfatase activity